MAYIKKSLQDKEHASESWVEKFRSPMVQWLHAASSVPDKAIVVSNISDKFQLHAHDFETGYDRQVTRKKNGMLFGSISPDGKYIYYLNDATGNEHGHFVRIPFSGGKTVDMTPDIPPYFSYTLASNGTNDIFCFVAASVCENKVYLFSRNTPPVCVYTSIYSISEPIISSDGLYICISVSGEKKRGWSECMIIDSKTHAVYARHLFEGEITPLTFAKQEDSLRVCMLSNASGYRRPIFWSCGNTNTTEVQSSHFHGDVFVLTWDEDRENLLICNVSMARHHLYVYNTSSKHVVRVGPTTGNFDLFFGSVVVREDGSFIVRWSDINTPPRYLTILAPQFDTWEDAYVPNKHPPTSYPVQSVWFKSSDGTRVQAWIVLPKNKKQSFPFIIDIHGGPHSVASDEYSPEIHAWLESGFGYCSVNYRGSIGFGREFQEKIYGDPGHWEVEDVVAAQHYLIKKGLADPSHIIITGWSWGGYVALLALGRYPSLWTAGIAAASIADCVMQYEDEPAYFKAIDEQRFKGTPETVRERYTKSSPTTYAGKIQAPVLILHGRNDVRCPSRQITHLEHLMRKAKKNIKIVWYLSGHTGNYTDIPFRVRLFRKEIAFATTQIKKTPSKNHS